MNKQARGTSGMMNRLFKSSTVSIFLILLVMCAIMAFSSPAFMKITNILSTARSFSAIAIAGIGVSMVIITGGIDLSLGSVYGLAGVVSALCVVSGIPLFLSLLLGIAAAALVGLANGAMVVYLKLPPFIATLGTMQIARGICYITTQGYPVSGLPESYSVLGQGYFLGVPVPIWVMVLIAILLAIFLNQTTTGRRIFALGGNEEATRISGINTKKLKVLVYTLCSALGGLAGIITASKLGVGQPTAGSGFEMDAIAAVVIGGTSMKGGEGSMLGTLIGILIIGVISNGLNLLGVAQGPQKMVKGLIIVIAVIIDVVRRKASESAK